MPSSPSSSSMSSQSSSSLSAVIMSRPSKKQKSAPIRSFNRDDRLAKTGARHPNIQKCTGAKKPPARASTAINSNRQTNSEIFDLSTSDHAVSSLASHQQKSIDEVIIDDDSEIVLSGDESGDEQIEKRQLAKKSIERAALLKVRKMLETRSSKNNETESLAFWKTSIMDKLLEHRDELLMNTSLVDAYLSRGGEMVSQLTEVFPSKVTAKITKPKIVDICIATWRILEVVVFHPQVNLNHRATHNLNDYIGTMERSFNYCRSVALEEMATEKTEKSLKMPPDEELRGYLEDGAKAPPKAYRMCPRCNEPFMHEPPTNKDFRESNAKAEREYAKVMQQFDEFKKGTKKEPPLDVNMRPMLKPPPLPKLQKEILVCKAYMCTHSFAVDGFKCNTCIDRSCGMCKNKCRFVCTKE